MKLGRTAAKALNEVVDFYLESMNFNGLPYAPYAQKRPSRARAAAVADLVKSGLVQVVSGKDYPNMHIRPWPSRRRVEDQLLCLGEAERDAEDVCLYPTSAAMTVRVDAGMWSGEPYRRALALGRGQLETAVFSLDALEHYRNDPRYRFEFSDFEVTFGIEDDAYRDESEPERDKIAHVRAGFAYDPDSLSSPKVARYVALFLCDLADLTPEHQRRWQTFEVQDAARVVPHPVWTSMMLGADFPDRLGVFEKVLSEMEAINDLFGLAFGTRLFRTTTRPREWGWLLRPSTRDWDEFVLATDKLLSDNIEHAGLSAAGSDRRDSAGQDLGSISRLERLFIDTFGVNPDVARRVIEPLRAVRKERQRPAHGITTASVDPLLLARQRDLLTSIAQSLVKMREVLATHPRTAGWKPDPFLEIGWYRL